MGRRKVFFFFFYHLGTHTRDVRQPFVRLWLGLLGWIIDIGLVDGSQIFGGTYCLHLRGTLKIEAVSYL